MLLYPSVKRWFGFPQLVLAICWGFAVLIPWAAASGTLQGWPLALTWLATLTWTFGFDTVYAMADRDDDQVVGVRSSALSLGARAPQAVALCYVLTAAALALAAKFQGIGGALFWLPWALASAGMLREALLLQRPHLPPSTYGHHFSNQVKLGGLLLLALILSQR